MAPLSRFSLPSSPQHVIVCGNNRSDIFCADEDYRLYLDKLHQACDRRGVDFLLSDEAPIKTSNFEYPNMAFEGAHKYADWVFAYNPVYPNK